jgi:hypothetical protein
MRPLWTQRAELMPPSPAPRAIPHVALAWRPPSRSAGLAGRCEYSSGPTSSAKSAPESSSHRTRPAFRTGWACSARPAGSACYHGTSSSRTPWRATLTALDLTDFPARYGAPYIVLHRSDLLDILLTGCTEAAVGLETGANVTDLQDDGAGVSSGSMPPAPTAWRESLPRRRDGTGRPAPRSEPDRANIHGKAVLGQAMTCGWDLLAPCPDKSLIVRPACRGRHRWSQF